MVLEEDNLERIWLDQLAAEHRHICWQHRVSLLPPIFEISEGSQLAGSWTAGFAGLKMAGWLLRGHGWQVVLEVLRHEMAHQYVHEVLGCGWENPHGSAFQEACRRLGVHPRFRRAVLDLSSDGHGKQAVPAILAKVEKLLALAGSANEHEAALAMAKANALLRRHNINRLEQGTGTAYDYLIIDEGKQRITAVQRTMAALLRDFFYVQVVIGRQFDARAGRTCRVIELIGARENLAVADYVYAFLVKRLDDLWQAYRRLSRAAMRETKSFQLGVLKGFTDRLRSQEKQAMAAGPEGSNALICLRDTGLDRYYQQRHPRLKRVRHPGLRVFADSFQAGRQEGHTLVIHKAVVDRAPGCGLLE